MSQFFENFTILSLITTSKNITMALGAHMRPYSYMYCAPSRDGVLQIYLPIYYKPKSSILHTQVNQIQGASSSWMDPIQLYIVTGELPDDRNIVHKIQIQSARFSIIDGQLYKRPLDGPYLKCLTPEQGQYVLVELHEGI